MRGSYVFSYLFFAKIYYWIMSKEERCRITCRKQKKAAAEIDRYHDHRPKHADVIAEPVVEQDGACEGEQDKRRQKKIVHRLRRKKECEQFRRRSELRREDRGLHR